MWFRRSPALLMPLPAVVQEETGHTIRFCRLRRRNNRRGRGGAQNNYHIGTIHEGFSGVIILGQPSPGMAGGAATAAAAAAPTRAEEDENIEIEEME
ncbi:hypothetical protein PFICI_14009 [Pestalotiopsis fici W106-1]|uniref:Uncharacterized protein n=1 Tax=Pestalotiopsis fici (strain W106-1 / CGMCC3.15140) TaxID=1229662 RepID=W3WJU8_PESFW|nr:uncharacterized protein PFICI_14009 [Pestalotiopsis fici W106-1]ETS74143.1 hypothetical protein PFICI_14009 [Pestalotiopsis fici W106-1]